VPILRRLGIPSRGVRFALAGVPVEVSSVGGERRQGVVCSCRLLPSAATALFSSLSFQRRGQHLSSRGALGRRCLSRLRATAAGKPVSICDAHTYICSSPTVRTGGGRLSRLLSAGWHAGIVLAGPCLECWSHCARASDLRSDSLALPWETSMGARGNDPSASVHAFLSFGEGGVVSCSRIANRPFANTTPLGPPGPAIGRVFPAWVGLGLSPRCGHFGPQRVERLSLPWSRRGSVFVVTWLILPVVICLSREGKSSATKALLVSPGPSRSSVPLHLERGAAQDHRIARTAC
jgi:hypothetical protein